jgi:hypothetical protein
VVPVSHEQHDYASHVMHQLRRALPDLQAEVDKKNRLKKYIKSISCASLICRQRLRNNDNNDKHFEC